MRLDIFGLEEDICVKIYNPANKELIATYRSFAEASKKLGLSQKTVRNATHTKKRQFSTILNMEVAIRVAATKKAA
jgi:hypothetical protein